MMRLWTKLVIMILLTLTFQGCISGSIDLRPEKYRKQSTQCNPDTDPNLCYPPGYFPQ